MGLFSFRKQRNNNLDLDKILSNERSDLAIMEIDEQLNKITDYGEKIEKLNKSQRVLIVIENLEREVNNGGFNQFYFNSSGDFANETVEYLNLIGAFRTAKIVEKANEQWENGFVPEDKTERENILELIEEHSDKVWEECDNDFFEYEDNISELLIKFVKENRKDFE